VETVETVDKELAAKRQILAYTEDAANGDRNPSIGLATARNIVASLRANVKPGTPPDPFICGWYLEATRLELARDFFVENAADYIFDGVAVCPNNPRTRLWQGIVADSYPSRRSTHLIVSLSDRDLQIRKRIPERVFEFGPEAAEKAFREAARLDPNYFDAHLRLGELLARSGKRNSEALTELAAVTAGHADPPVAYLAHMFSGRAKENVHDVTGALTEYEAALAICRECQSPYVAIGYAAGVLGDRALARDAAEHLAALPQESKVSDPWWTFHRAGGGLEVDLLDALKAMVK
jgi:hypothetical protein